MWVDSVIPNITVTGEIPKLPPQLDETPPDFKVNKKIFIHDGDIAELECDVIVVSVSKQMAPKGMPLVYKAAGPELSKSAKEFAPRQVKLTSYSLNFTFFVTLSILR